MDFIKEIWQKYQQKEILVAIVTLILAPLFWKVIGWLWAQLSKIGGKLLSLVSRRASFAAFERRYLAQLTDEHKCLKIRGIKTRAPVAVELEQVYVSLKVKGPGAPARPFPEEMGIEPRERPRAMELAERMVEREQVLDLGQALRQHKRLVLLGVPGSGKTTLLSYLALTYARGLALERLLAKKRLPILIPLREVADKLPLLPDHLTASYQEMKFEPPNGFFQQRLQDGGCIVLLDGLDEVRDEEQRRRVAAWVDKLVSIYPNNRYIVASRPLGYSAAPLTNGFTELTIRDFEMKDVEQFAENWTLAIELAAIGDTQEARRRADLNAKDLIAAIKANERVQRLAVNPLLLSIIALVHRYRATLPQRRVELYEECTDVLLGYWDIAKGIVVELDPARNRQVLQPLALEMHQRGLREIGRQEVEEILGRELPKVGGEAKRAGEFLDNIRDRSGLLVERGLGQFGFSHLTFQEYLTARALAEGDNLSLLVEHLRDNWWREAILLYAGLRDATPLIQAIREQREDIFKSNLFMAGRCLADATAVDPSLRREVIDNLLDEFWNGEYILLEYTAQEVLAEIKSDYVIEHFLGKLRDENAYVRGQAAEALGEIRSEWAVDPLLASLKDKSDDVRGRAAEALGWIRSKWAVEPLIATLRDKSADVRERAASALGRIGSERAVEPFIAALRDESDDVRGWAAEALGWIGSERAIEPLIAALRDEGEDVRGWAAWALGRIGSERAIEPLIVALRDEGEDVQGWAAWALGWIGSERAIEPLIASLRDESDDVRERAAEALGRIGSERAVEPLIACLRDESDYVRWSAAEALGRIGSERALEPLIAYLRDESDYVRGDAAEALGQIGSERAIEPIIASLRDESDYVRWSAAEALGRIGSERALEPLIASLRDESETVRWHAAEALGKIRSKRAMEPLLATLKDEEVKDAAFAALKQISEKTGRAIYPDEIGQQME